MSKFKNLLVIFVVLAITGWIRIPIEQKLAEKLHEHKLVPPRLSLEERARLKQKAFVATYGSLRPTIAAFMSTATVSLHGRQDWDEIEKQFEEIVLLDPYNFYYWDTSSWHMAYNASIDLKKNSDLTEIGKERVFRKYIQKGRDIIDKGIQINPDDWRFLEIKANLLAHRFRTPDYAKAIEVNKKLLEHYELPYHTERLINVKLLSYIQKSPDKHQEAYDLAFKLFQRGGIYRTPVVVNQIFTSQNHPLTTVKNPMSLAEIYGSERNALKDLKIIWNSPDKDLKTYGVEDTIRKLEKQFNIPNKERVFPHRPLFIK